MSLESQLNRNYRRPERPKAPLRRNQASRPQRQFVSAPERPKAPLRTNQQKSRPVVRPTRTTFNSRRQQAARNELFQRRLLALSMLGPAPSPDRTTGREKAGFASSAFTGKGPFGDATNGFFPDAGGSLRAGYSMRAGSPSQQKIAAKDASYSAAQPVRDLEQILSQSPAGTVAGSVVANRTWAKLAPLFGRDPNKPVEVTFKNTPPGTGGYAKDGKVTVNPDSLTSLFVSPKGRQTLAGLLAHEFAHTQQASAGDWRRSSNPARKGGAYSPTLEGGADAFRNLVAPLVGGSTSPATDRTDYGRAQLQHFMSGTDKTLHYNLPKALISQFPRVSKRLTPIRQQRRNLAR